MKTITREVKVFKYVFANIDLATKSAHNLIEVRTTAPLGHRAVRKYCEENDNAVLINKEMEAIKYSMPLDLFVETCEEYAKKVAAGEAPAIDPSDDEEDDSAEDEDFDD